MNEKLSIVVPIYNSEKYLEKCVLSILNQLYKNIEVILVNDGSKDDSEKICYKLKNLDSRIKVISTENMGVSHARNIGIENATGKYLAFVDSDDIIEENIYVEMISLLKGKDMPIVGYKYVDENNKVLNEKIAYNYEGIFNKSDFFIFCENFIMNSPVNKIFYLNIIKQYDLKFNEKISLGEDLIFILEYIKYIDFFYIKNITPYRYLISNTNSLSQKYRADFLDIQIEIIESMYNVFIENNIDFKKYEKRFNTKCLELLMQVMNNTMSVQNTMTLKEKFNYNNKIIKNKLFKNILKKADLKQINIFTKIGFKINSYRFIYYTNRFIRIIRRR